MGMSILDNDLYKFSMQQAALQLYPNTLVVYEFKNRKPNAFKFSTKGINLLSQKISALASLRLSLIERDWLESCNYFSKIYLDFLAQYSFDPDKHVKLTHSPTTGNITLQISGNWVETILYEVPLLALISECYFEMEELDWINDLENQEMKAKDKCEMLSLAGCKFSEFGTRRRRNGKIQQAVIKGLSAYSAAKHTAFLGTSNLHFARMFNIKPMGTFAHEWIMAISILEKDLLHSNHNALVKWNEVYPDTFQTALADTFGTFAFIADFSLELAHKYTCIRQDSGDPKVFVDRIVKMYGNLGVDPATKAILFSDSLSVDKVIDLKQYVDTHGFGMSPYFGIGTHFTNDFQKASCNEQSNAMDIVIKLRSVNGAGVVKLSDDFAKSQGDLADVQAALELFANAQKE